MAIRDGTGVMAIALVHEVVGLVMGGSIGAGIVADGIFDSLGEDFARLTLFWFHATGVALFVIGDVMRQYEVRTGDSPRRFGAWMVAIGAVGVFFMPASGFWLVLGWGGWMLVRRRARGPEGALAPTDAAA